MRDHCSAAVEVFAAFFRVFRSGSLVGQALLDGKSWTNLPNSVKLQASQWCWRRGRKRERKRVPRNGFIDFSCYCWFVRLLFDIWNVFIKHIKHKKHLYIISLYDIIYLYIRPPFLKMNILWRPAPVQFLGLPSTGLGGHGPCLESGSETTEDVCPADGKAWLCGEV